MTEKRKGKVPIQVWDHPLTRGETRTARRKNRTKEDEVHGQPPVTSLERQAC